MKKSLLSAVLVIGYIAQAQATPLTELQMLQEFNVVVLNNATSYSDVDGRAYVGGNLTGGNYVQHPADTPASAYSGLTVRGSASGVQVNGLGASIGGSLTTSIINSGSATVAGNAQNDTFNGPAAIGGTSNSVNFNGGTFSDPTTALSNAALQANATDFATLIQDASNQFKAMADTGSTVTVSGGKVIFNAAPVNGVAVFDLSGISNLIFGSSEFDFNLNGASSVIFNTDATNASIAANFLDGSAQAIASKTIWNFWNAQSIDIDSQFGGSILAPTALLTNRQNIEGGVFVDALNQQGEIHLQTYTGNVPKVPEPGAFGLMLAGLAMLFGGTYVSRRQAA